MAERRMFTKKIIDSDAFLDMPLSAQALYFHLNMRADDDGFVNGPRKIQRMVGASNDDMNLLIAKRFILTFESGVIVIKHWRMHNLLRKDRYTPTQYQDEYKRLETKENGAYTEAMATNWQPTGNQVAPQVSIGKVSIVEDSLKEEEKTKRFTPPSVEEVNSYILEKGYDVDAEAFVNFYESKGWFVGKNKMKSWKAALVTWNLNKRNRYDRKEDLPF